MPATHTADFQTAAVKATDLDAVEKINVGIETDKVRKHLNIVAATPEIRIQDKTGSAPEVNATTMAIVADGGTTHFRAGTTTFAEGAETKGNVKFQSSTGATTHAEIVGSSGKLELQDGGLGLKRGSNVTASGTSGVIQEITGPHARESAVLKKYPEVAFAEGKFETTGNATNSTYWAGHSTVFQGGYSVKTSHHSTDDGGQYGWHVFDDNSETVWKIAEDYNTSGNYDYGFTNVQSRLTDTNSTNHDGDHVIMGSPNKLKIAKVSVTCKSSDRRVVNYSVLGSDSTGTTGWTLLDSGSFAAQDANIATITSPTTHFKYHAFVVRSITPGVNGQRFMINSIHYYGYEETNATGDTSVDTTVKSVYNAPDLTSAALYIDAAKTGTSVTDQSGSTPSVTVTATGVTYDSTEKAWELTGAATSNIVSGDLASLVGDHPHSVSAWVKADQLNGDGLFHVGTAEGEGDAASRVGFVDDSHISWGGDSHFFSNAEWHNVTYTYNGEGSDKKLYLDGRLVGTAKNEDTFGDYPPFAMSGYSEFGYTVSENHPRTNYENPYALFDNDTGDDNASPYEWWSSGDVFSSDGQTYTGGDSIGGHSGAYVKLELPHKLKLAYVAMWPRDYGNNTTPNPQCPKDFKFIASNDNVNWDLLYTETGFTDTGNVEHDFAINSQKGYKYYAMVISKVRSTTLASICELKLYGHRENDLVRFPDPTNVLKYPHVAMTGPAQRGYVVTTNNGTDVSNVFAEGNSSTVWATASGTFSTSSPYGAISGDTFTDSASTQHTGHWMKLQLPRKITISRFKTTQFLHSQYQLKTYVLLGSNDDSTWVLIHSEADADMPGGSGSGTEDVTSFSEGTPSAYKYYMLLVKNLEGAGGLLKVGNTEFYGTEPEDVVARVGDGFDGKVRNVRVYSTALSDARVQEIFDADKDEFGLAKSSISVYRGHLGIGTSEPKGALTVMDEIADLEEFPPRRLTSAETYLEGHGVFKASASYTLPDPNHPSAPWKVFSKDTETNATGWLASNDHNAVNGSNPGEYNGTNQLAGSTPLGEWVKIELPHKIKLNKYALKPWGINNRYGVADYPKTFYIYGSNDGSSWELVDSRVNTNDTPKILGTSTSSNETIYYNVTQNGLSYYDRYAIVITKINSEAVYAVDNTIFGAYVAFGEWRLFGTREQGASTLHNGELSLTRNLTVPRIGPPLDADDTPRRDRLVVEYNTSTNPTENGVVKDTSGRGLDGLLDNTYGGAAYNPYYDATEKALVFDGSNDYVFQNDVHLKTGVGGVYSASVWVRNRASTGTHTVYSLGTYAQLTTSTLYVLDATLQVVFYNSDLSVTYTIPKNTWTHIVVTHGGGQTSTTTKMYINGVDVGLAATSGTTFPLSTVNFPSPCNLFLGKNSDNSVYGGPMDLSNFKLWDTELSAEDAKRLYDMGRLGNVIAKPLYVTAPLHAPGTVVQVVTNPTIGQTSYTSSSGADVNLAVLQTSITPKFSNSKMVVQVYMSYEADYNAVLFVRANDADIPSGRTYGLKEGTIPVAYDGNLASTPNSSAFVVHHNVSSTQPVTYKVFYKANQSGTIKLNEGYSSTDEHGMCYVVIWEIAQ